MSSFLGSVWDVVGNQVTGFLGTEQERQDKVTGLLVDKPFEFGKSIGLYQDKIEAPPVINKHPNEPVTGLSLLDNIVANTVQDAKVFGKNLPSNLFEIAEGGIDIAMNPIKTGKAIFGLGSGLATKAGLFPNIDNTTNEEMATFVLDSAQQFFSTPGAVRKAALEHPADVVAMVFGGVWGARKLENYLSAERLAAITDQVRTLGALPVGLSIKDVGDNPFFDAAGTYSKAEKTVMDMKQPSMAANQVVPYLQGRGILAAEIKDLNIDDYVKNLDGQSVTQQGLLDHISLNRTSLLSTSLLSPTNTGVNTLNYTPNMAFVHDPYETWEEYGPTPAVERGVNERYQIGEIETPDGTLSVVENPEVVQEISENLMADMRGSFEVHADTEISHIDRSLRARDTEYREHYPFNYVQDNEYYSFTVRQADASRDDDKMARVFFQMHEDKPEKYPLTHGLEAHINFQSMEALNKAARENQPAIGQLLQENKTSLTALQELNNSGIEQWDQLLAKDLHHGGPDMMARGSNQAQWGQNDKNVDEVLDFQDALYTIAEKDYLQNPTFEQRITVDTHEGYDGPEESVEYLVAGNNDNGYFVYDPEMNLIADSVDLPRAQAMLNTDAQERGFLEAVRSVGDERGHGQSQYHGYLGSVAKQYENTYSEELISLVPRSGESKYTEGHYGTTNPNTLISYRKTIRPRGDYHKDGSSITENPSTYLDMIQTDTPIYFIEEMQSDWIQDGRQFGFTQTEYDDIGDKLRVYDKDLHSYRTAISVFEDTMDEYDLYPDDKTHLDTARAALQDVPNYMFKAAFIASVKKTSHKGIWNQFTSHNIPGAQQGLSTATMNSPEFKKAFEDFDLQTKRVISDINADWENNEYNPDSANFDIHKYSETRMFSDVEDYVVNQQDVTDRKREGWEDHDVMDRTPLKHKDIYITTGLQDAIQKAHAKGLKFVSWSSSSQILDKWNRSRELNEKGNIRYQELYKNIYDKQLPNAARKLLEKYKGGKLQKMEIDGEVNHVLEITPELIENMRKALPNLPEDSKVIPLPQYGEANKIDSGLLKTDIIEQGLLA